jgi:hypothetical protein
MTRFLPGALYNTVASLLVKIKEVMGNLDKDTVSRNCRGFHIRLETVVDVNSDFFE